MLKIRSGLGLAALALMLVTPAWGQGTLFVEGNNVGIGTDTPAFPLEIQGPNSRVEVVNTNGTNAARTLFKLTNNGFPRFVLENTATADTWLMAAGSGGTFVFGKVGSGVNEFVVESGGDVTIAGQMTATGYNTSSSRALKEGIVLVDGKEILSRLVDLPIAEWSFQADSTNRRHLGPMAEDFQAAFALGSDDRYIGLMDAAGVSMAAIQGLHSLAKEKEARIEDLERQNAELVASNEALEQRLAALEEAVAGGLSSGR